MERKIGIVKLSRKQLYDEIWLLSVAGVARKYNLNYSRLIGSCKEAGIPYPSSGYWTRKNMGKDVSSEIVTLNGDENLLVELVTKNSVIKRIKKVKPEANSIENKPNEGVYKLYAINECSSLFIDGGGHYISYIKTEQNIWYKFDDESVRIETPDIFNNRNVVGLYYIKI